MSRSALRILTLALSLAALGAAAAVRDVRAAAEEIDFTSPESDFAARLHPWGRFEPGAWKLVRVVSETLDGRGQVISSTTTDTKTALVDVDDDGVTLEIQPCMEVAGKRFQAEPQTIKQGFYGELAAPNVKFTDPADGHVTIDDRKIPCKIRSLEIAGPSERVKVRLHTSTTVWPYVLRRESVTTDSEGKNLLSQTTATVTALDMPVRVLGETWSGAHVKTVTKNAKGTVTTLAVVLPGVPGGVISYSSKEVDASGKVIRRGTLELIDYNANPDKDRHGLFNRKRAPRHTKPPANP